MEPAVQTLDKIVANIWPFDPSTPPQALGITGAILCVLNLFMVGGPILASKLRGKHSSPACIPFGGPLLLTLWARATHKPWWAIPLVWCCDAGTILVLVSIPMLISHCRKTSSHTKILGLHASDGNRHVTLTIHSTGRYRLQMCWEKRPWPSGNATWGHLGDVSEVNGSYLLKPDYGGSKNLELQSDGSFQVVEEQLSEPTRAYSIANWHFERDKGT
jgi:hypothetical protein